MAEVFISYARTDHGFARDLNTALQKLQRDTWIDWRSIPDSAQWRAEIFAPSKPLTISCSSSAPTHSVPECAGWKSLMPWPTRSVAVDANVLYRQDRIRCTIQRLHLLFT
jgi:hypothetical protein